MANYSVLKAAVQAVIKTNGNQEITGANMQSTLISIINSLGTGYQFMGVATPSTSPGTPDYNVAYIGGAGTYANFGTSVTVPVGSICVFKYNGSWNKEQIAVCNGVELENINNILKKDTEQPTIEKKINDYFVNTNGTRGYAGGFAIYGGVPVKKGQLCSATISINNASVTPLAFSLTNNYTSTMSCGQLVPYHAGNNIYQAVAEFDGYVFISAVSSDTPTLTIDTYYSLEEIETEIDGLHDDIDTINGLFKEEENKSISLVMDSYYVNTSGTRGNYSGLAIFGGVPIQRGQLCIATITGANAAVTPLAFSETNNTTSTMSCGQLVPYHAGNNIYQAVAEFDGFVFISSSNTDTPSLVYADYFYPKDLQEEIDDVKEEIYNENNEEKDIDVSILLQGYYINPNGERAYYSNFSIYSLIPVLKGDVVTVSGMNINSAVCPIAFNPLPDTTSTTQCTPLAVQVAYKTEYTATAPNDGYIIISNSTSSAPTVKLVRKFNADAILESGNTLALKSIMLFGDSLTAGSTQGLISFAKILADTLNVPYRPFVYDRFDTEPNVNDVDVDFPCVTNYAKDGTTNSNRTGRVDSVLQRVKNHITSSTQVDYILIECCINDYTSSTKGTISNSYTGTFDVTTAIGAIEETCLYLSTLGKHIRFGFYIPWGISYVPDDYFNDYIPVFEKWAVPLYDMRKCAGFDMRHCERHRELYSLPASSYADYNPSTTYNLDDKVKYQGNLYKCNADNVVGILPTNTTYWTMVSDGNFDGCHLNNLGHWVVAGKIQSYIERL